jgi:hypothetical protein
VRLLQLAQASDGIVGVFGDFGEHAVYLREEGASP